jgi:hypothetical protein
MTTSLTTRASLERASFSISSEKSAQDTDLGWEL